MHREKKPKIYLAFILLVLLSCCMSPTFDSPMVKKGSSGWVGAVAGFRCFDYSSNISSYSMANTRGLCSGFGFNYGFNENIGLTNVLLIYIINGEYSGTVPKRAYSLYMAYKFEATRNKSRNVFSFTIGPALPELVRTELMVGFKDDKNKILSFGTHLSIYAPYDFFINFGPAQGPGFVFYVGYQIPAFHNPLNLGAGIGYRF